MAKTQGLALVFRQVGEGEELLDRWSYDPTPLSTLDQIVKDWPLGLATGQLNCCSCRRNFGTGDVGDVPGAIIMSLEDQGSKIGVIAAAACPRCAGEHNNGELRRIFREGGRTVTRQLGHIRN
jgi:hypothetical protein